MRRMHPWRQPPVRLLLSIASGMLRMAAGVLCCASVLLTVSLPEWLLSLISLMLWCWGAFASSDCFARHTRRGGMACGLLCGGILCLVMLTGMLYLRPVWESRTALRCAAVLLAAVCGGIRGVNRKITKPPN